ncbi:MFS transporter [Bifidobacterium imperatoris]|uniref:MFS transporter n=1 Tax=Bifidobacterium imperatoris TaxID=2020965 RepID=A0A2N5IRE8_9BIFI|nr:MFS transporter [Bifidobacterium imperatoris]PLS24531.1 MFS transporter [Bifidobacterium imperatoris]QSY57576.1 MFS transporter [Bifidobacterium imperatoris]
MEQITEHHPIPSSASRFAASILTALVFVVALNLRAPLTSVGPLLPRIGASEHLNATMQGLLGSLPILAFAVVSPMVHRAAERLGIERTVLAAMAFLTLGIVIRSACGTIGLWAGTLVIGCSIAVGNVLVPAIVKRDYPGHTSLATGIYSACMTGMAAFASAATLPLSDAIGWQGTLGIWAIPAGIVTLLWLWRSRANAQRTAPAAKTATNAQPRSRQSTASETRLRVSMWKRPEAWAVTLFMGLQSVNYYVCVTWLPTIEVSFGVPADRTGWHLAVFQLVGIIMGLLIPVLLKGDSQVAAVVVASVPLAIGALGLAFTPWLDLLWIIVASIGSGCSLVVALSLIGLKTSTTEETTQLSGMAQCVGYLLAAVGPTLAGTIYDITSGWRTVLIMLAILAVAQTAIGIIIGRNKEAGR